MRNIWAALLLALLSFHALASPCRGAIFSEPDSDSNDDTQSAPAEPASEPPEEVCNSSLRIVYPSGTLFVIGYSQGYFQKISNKTFLFKEGGPICLGEMGDRGHILELLRAGGYGGNQFLVSLRPENKVQVIEELRSPQSSSTYPFLQWLISCAKGPCSISGPACILKVPKDVNADAVRNARQWNKKQKSFDSFENMIRPLLIRSLAGDGEARRLLMGGSFSPTGLDEDVLSAVQDTFKNAQRFGCRQVAASRSSRDTRNDP